MIERKQIVAEIHDNTEFKPTFGSNENLFIERIAGDAWRNHLCTEKITAYYFGINVSTHKQLLLCVH